MSWKITESAGSSYGKEIRGNQDDEWDKQDSEFWLLAWESMSGCVGFKTMTLRALSPLRLMRWNVERLSTRNAHTATHLSRRNTRASCGSHPSLSAYRMNFFFNMRGTVVRQIAEDRALPGMFWQRKNNVCSLVRDWISWSCQDFACIVCAPSLMLDIDEILRKMNKNCYSYFQCNVFFRISMAAIWSWQRYLCFVLFVCFHIGWHVTVISWISSVRRTKVVLSSFYHQMTLTVEGTLHWTLAFNTIKLLIKQKKSYLSRVKPQTRFLKKDEIYSTYRIGKLNDDAQLQ